MSQNQLTPEMQQQLEQLKDIQLPEPVSWWPLAYGWWGLMALALLAVVMLWRHYQQNSHKHTGSGKPKHLLQTLQTLQILALNELAAIENKYANLFNSTETYVPEQQSQIADYATDLSALIKRVLLQSDNGSIADAADNLIVNNTDSSTINNSTINKTDSSRIKNNNINHTELATLTGQQWQAYLIQTGMADASAQFLASAPYQPQSKETANNLLQTLADTKTWIVRYTSQYSNRQKNKQTNSQTGKHIDKQTERQA